MTTKETVVQGEKIYIYVLIWRTIKKNKRRIKRYKMTVEKKAESKSAID